MSEKLVGNIHMSTRQFGHECTFKWRLRNLSLLKMRTNPSVQHDFALHPNCGTRWRITVKRVDGGYEVVVGTPLSKVPIVDHPGTYIGLIDRKGEFVLPVVSLPDKSEGDNVCMVLKIRSDVENTVIIGEDDKVVVELENDTLVILGGVKVSICCTRTKIDKEETTDAVPKTTERLDICELIKEGFVVA